MNDLEQEEQLVLERARQALSPSHEQAQRVLDGILRTTREPPHEGPTSTESGLSQTLRTSQTVRGAGKLLAALALAGLTGVYGYRRGLEDGRGASAASTPHLERPVEATLPRAPEVAPAASAPGHALEPGAASNSVPMRPHKSSAEALKAPPARELSLSEELEVLKRVERALREGEPGLALELLDDLEQRRPVSALAEERLAASVMARCALGLGGQSRLVDEFARARPDSVYLSRVRNACRGR